MYSNNNDLMSIDFDKFDNSLEILGFDFLTLRSQ